MESIFKLVEVFTSFAKIVAEKCDYPYPEAQEEKMMEYYQKSKEMFDKLKPEEKQ